jgi:hypothetical protein
VDFVCFASLSDATAESRHGRATQSSVSPSASGW